ncbi:hypothetical protein BST27_28985 [Mycobacterium intermedium]|uniref:DUF4247 domain-containing protein n=1 Tax=Mycobacterium intermedium TaxID=28445 RepID=A0A1E3S3Q8_MYCIE|nr:DUF4247 domain-containing protein [Mycobacterium intermedium]MCV6966375.1 DUF4247 domain-containing protein [Mycobacterium intermedium]ODQ96759.1 hypothetical protein BHQ20_28570 [Mycobacterium intermedium]OPE45746.1 hypothetical protein BV508_28545 [Mycobacterium intermedium]ORA93290.1 hypothetical protein BST27_28985 [Mycobacterium intermedium]
MSRNRLLLIAAGLAACGLVSLIFGVVLLSRNIESYVASHYHEYSHDVNGKRYVCSGSPKQVADTLAHYKSPAARASSGANHYLRYNRVIVIVGPDGGYPCSIRVEPLSAGYNHGSFIFLGPGFTPGSPSGGSGGSPGGPGGTK